MAGILVGQRQDETRNINTEQRGKPAVSYAHPTSVPRKHIVQLSHAEVLAKYWRLYCKHSSLVGLKYFVKDEVTWFEKVIWFLVYTLAVFMLTTSTLVIQYESTTTPISSTPEAEYFPTHELEFPELTLQKLISLTTNRFEANISNLTANEILNEISKLGDLYDSLFVSANNYTQLIQLLSKFYNNAYDITDIMERLTPQCSDMLLRCRFQSQLHDCSDMFTVGKTYNGFCCTFNYVFNAEDTPKFTKHAEPVIYKTGEIGGLYGLSVMMTPHLDDYLYPILPTTGWTVMIFDPYDYPDSSSGSVTEVLVAPLTEKLIQLDAVGLYSTDIIRSYPVEQRGCIFSDEQKSTDTTYTCSDCIIACKQAHIWSKCGCRPFLYPRQGSTESSRRTCSVQDIQCLLKYYDKSYEIIPYGNGSSSSMVKDENAVIKCYNCYPACDDISYSIYTSTSILKPGYLRNRFTSGINLTHESIVHVFFSKMGTVFLKQDQTYRWYEHFSDCGGVYGFFIGFSIISLVEIIYFSILCLAEIFSSPETTASETSHKNEASLYWNEFWAYPKIDEEIIKRSNVRF